MLNFCMCSKPACYSCVCRGGFVYTSYRSSLTSYGVSCLLISHPFMAHYPLGLNFVWLWAFPHSAHSFVLFCSLAFPTIPFCYSCCKVNNCEVNHFLSLKISHVFRNLNLVQAFFLVLCFLLRLDARISYNCQGLNDEHNANYTYWGLQLEAWFKKLSLKMGKKTYD